jgi:dipeptidyl aminopeptidase/acylaminoacyl peptidase
MTARILLALTAFAAFAKVPITHESMWLMKRVGAPAVSPDGRWVVFPVVEPAYDEKEQASDLWLVPADGGAPPRRLTFTKGAESGLAWSPDSRRLAFTTKREGDEAAQVYVLDLAGGGEAARITSIPAGASSPRWRPDGGAILFTSGVSATSEAERKARKYHARVYTGFPIRHWDRWLDDTHAHLFVQTLEPGAKPRDLLAGTKLAALPGYGGAPSDTGGEELNAVWAPDGQSIVFAATTTRDRGAYDFVDTQLFQAPASGGEPAPLTAGLDSHSHPAFRPDGRALYCLRTPRTANVYNAARLESIPWPGGGSASPVTQRFDRDIDQFAVSPDSRTIYLLAEDAGHMRLYTAPAAGGEVRPAFDMPLGSYANLSVASRAAAPVLIAGWESAVNPPEIVRIDPGAGRHAALTHFNDAQAEAIDWQPLRHFWFTSKRGKRIHNMLALPPGFDEKKKYPLVVLIHGGPYGMWRDQFVLRWNYHLVAQPGYVVLLTNYTGSTGFGEKFSQGIQGDPLAGPGEELNEAADEAVRQFAFIDGSRMAAGGASYGGHLANWLEATTTRYKCLFSHAGLINLESQWGTSDTVYPREVANGGPPWEQGEVWRTQNPIRYAAKFRTPMLLSVGEHDFRVPLNETLENWSALQRMKVPSRLLVFEDANHWILRGEDSRFFYGELLGWLKKYLGE